MSDEWFQRMIDIHSVVPFRMCRAVAPHMREPAKKEREQGVEVFRKIVNVSSISGTMGNAGQANYSSGKSAVVGLTKTLAKEWGQFKINVNAVAFGFIETRLTAVKDEYNVARSAARRCSWESPGRCASSARRDPAGPAGPAVRGRRRHLPPVHPVGQLRPRPGAEHHRRSVHRNDRLAQAAAAAPRAASDEPLEHAQEPRVHSPLLLQFPLHGQHGAPGDLDRLGHPVGRRRHDRESLAEAVDRLVVERVDFDCGRVERALEQAPGVISISWRGCGGGGEPATDEASTSFHFAHPGSLGCASASRLTSWASVPPSATFSTWMPRHMPRIGIPRSSARPTSSSSNASRCGSVAASSGWGSWP